MLLATDGSQYPMTLAACQVTKYTSGKLPYC